MVASVYHRIAAELRADADRLDRDYITRWFMAFASQRPLEIDHPRTGLIHVGGFSFGRDIVQRYDDFARAIIDDFLERHLRACEDGLETVPDAKLDAAVLELSGLLFSVATRLSDRQGKLKRRLLRKPNAGWSQLFDHSVRSMAARLATKVEEVRAMRSARSAVGVVNNVTIGSNPGAVQVGTASSSQSTNIVAKRNCSTT